MKVPNIAIGAEDAGYGGRSLSGVVVIGERVPIDAFYVDWGIRLKNIVK